MLTLKDLNTNKTWKFENKTDVSDFISTMSFGFEWQLIDNNTNEVIACHYYEQQNKGRLHRAAFLITQNRTRHNGYDMETIGLFWSKTFT